MRQRRAFVRPWHALAVSLVASLAGGALVTSAGLAARGRRPMDRWVGFVGGMLGAANLIGMSALRVPWQLAATVFLAVNLTAGLLFAWLLRRAETIAEPVLDRARGTFGTILWSAAGGALVTLYAGTGTGAAYLLAMDAWISTLFPSIASRASALTSLIGLAVDFTVVGALLGGYLALRPRVRTGSALAWALTGTVVGGLIVRFFATLVIYLPAFQGQTLARGPTFAQQLAASAAIGLAVRIATYVAAFVTAVLLADHATASAGARARALAAVVLTTAAGMVSLAVYSGRISYDLLLAGELLEKQDRLPLARSLYERGLAQRPDGAVSAHLQYRLAMLHRRLGDPTATRAALSNVVTTYTQRPDLVARAQRFLTALDHAPIDAPRKIIPGIATRTEFKSAYCMPNSLALVLQYWQVPLTARLVGRDITALDVGTTVSDASWYVQTKGLEQWLLPLADAADIRRLVDQDVPLLVYIPQHVLAVIGYDDALQSLVTYDVATEDIWVDQPIDEFLPKWRGEFAVIGIVLPPERFAALPADLQRDLTRWTRAYVHHDLHYPYHHSTDPNDQERALAHLEASIETAPELFFDLAHVVARPRWQHERRPDLFAKESLRTAAERSLAFARYHFENDEALRELALLNLEVENYGGLTRFLAEREKDRSLDKHADLVSLLGLLDFRTGDMEAAAAHLGTLKDEQRFPLVRGQALERTNALEAAITEYQRALEIDDGNEEQQDESELSDYSKPSTAEAKYRTHSGLLHSHGHSLHARTTAIQRIAALADKLRDTEQFLVPARAYLDAFPWDVELQIRYSEAVTAKLEREPDMPHDARDEFGRQLTRALGLASALDLSGRWRNRIARLEQHAASTP